MEHEYKSFSRIIIEALKAKGFSVARLSETTGIPENILSLLIEEKFYQLPAAPYVHGYIMKICDALSLSGEKVWSEYLKNSKHIRTSGEKDILPPNRFLIPKVNKKIVGGIIAGALILLYLIVRLPSIMGTPNLTLENLSSAITTTGNQSFIVRGTITPGGKLTMNGQTIVPDSGGKFTESVTLNPGFNTLTFVATQVLGKTYSVTKQIFYQISATSTTQTSTKPS